MQQFEEKSDGSRSEIKNKYMMKVLHHFSKKIIKFPFIGTILLLAMVKVLLMELAGRQKILLSASFEQNQKRNRSKCFNDLHRVTSRFMAKDKLQKKENLELWSVPSEVKGISKAHVAVVNADGGSEFSIMGWA